MTLYVQDGAHDVISRLHASAGCPLAHRERVTSVPDS